MVRPASIRAALAAFAILVVGADVGAAGQGALRAGASRIELNVEFGSRPIWLAGRGTHRPATFRHDPLYAQALYFDDGATSLALVSVDVIGLHHSLVDGLRERLRRERVVEHLIVFATHTHSAPDTIGVWGPDAKTSGLDATFVDAVEQRIAESVREAKQDLAPAQLSVSRGRTGRDGWVHRSRPPQIVDDTLSVLVVEKRNSAERIGTLVNYAAHPETLAPPIEANRILRHGISSDFVHFLRAGLPADAPILYANGAVGSVNPAPFPDERDGAARAARFGRQLAERVTLLEQKREAVSIGAIEVRTRTLRLPVENARFRHGYCLGLFGDRAFLRAGSDEVVPSGEACDPTAQMELTTEVSLVEIGSVRLLALPGEIFPEFMVGYRTDGAAEPSIAADDSCLPAVANAPGGPYLRETLERDGRTLFVLGLANDEIGYIVPKYDFVLDTARPYFEKTKCGSHYHETHSLGPDTGRVLLEAIEELFAR